MFYKTQKKSKGSVWVCELVCVCVYVDNQIITL